jgi:uridylate kinase
MNRVILKISGEALKDNNEVVSNNKLDVVLNTIRLLQKRDCKVGIVIGGGNFFRGREHTDMNKVTADTIGMLGTVMNALYLKDYLEKNNLNAVISTPFDFPNLIENYRNDELLNLYDNNIIIFGGGVGMSGYSTDSGVILAKDILKANMIIKMTNVDGVYDSDPKLNSIAIKYDRLTYKEVLDKDLKVMDRYAIEKCMEDNTKILVINFNDYSKLDDYFNGISIGTIIEE